MEFKAFSKEIPNNNITVMNIRNIPIPIPHPILISISTAPPRVFTTFIITTIIITITTITPRESKTLINNDIQKGTGYEQNTRSEAGPCILYSRPLNHSASDPYACRSGLR
ncbi:hypothetical protein [Paenibacillus sp. GCM10012306]|uniref:hypothetical protein n=1 Tax=Paenibacillus sp. GCM10012306 TaxID=3317342 RepID=UPI00360D3778